MEPVLTKVLALSFLRQHQPMPDERDLDEELIQQYDRVRHFCIDNPDPEFIPLLLNSFGTGMGLGVYQLVEDAFRPYSAEQVIPHLKKSLTSTVGGVKYWSAEIAADFPSLELLPLLTDLLKDEDSDVRSTTVIALAQFDAQIVTPILIRHLETETEDHIIDLVKECLSDLGADV